MSFSQLGTLHILEAMREAGHDIKTLFMCGGLSKNSLFVQIHANATGTKSCGSWQSERRWWQLLCLKYILVRVAGGAARPDRGCFVGSINSGSLCVNGLPQHTGGSETHELKYGVKSYRWQWFTNFLLGVSGPSVSLLAFNAPPPIQFFILSVNSSKIMKSVLYLFCLHCLEKCLPMLKSTLYDVTSVWWYFLLCVSSSKDVDGPTRYLF